MDMSKTNPTVSIPTFYSGKSVFITGATGFLGKVLIEKLLRSCPDIREIFLLIRPKKGLNLDERFRQLLANPLFDTLRLEQPNSFNKLIPVEGDIGFEGLGLSTVDRNILIEKTSVIFHVAAVVKFDNTLKDAIFQNVRSTRDICILGEQMKNLAVLLHVSTAYAQVDKFVIDEIVYPTELDWRKIIHVAEALDEDVLEVFKAKYIGTMPNHYIFTKKLAEQVITDYSGTLPCVICRPSIVTSTLKEPMKGWIDNFNGPTGLIVGIGKGVLRVLHIDSNSKNNYLPVDIVVKVLIIAAWKRAVKMINTRDDLIPVYNCAGGYSLNLAHSMVTKIGLDALKKIPLHSTIWTPNVNMIKSFFFYHLLMILFHVMPALVIDGLLQLSGGQPRLLKLHRKIFTSNQVLTYFVMNEWDIRNEKMISMSDEVSPDDQQNFGYAMDLDENNFDKDEYFKNCIIGGKRYLLNERMDQLDASKSYYNRMVWIDRIVKTLIGIFLTWKIYGIIV